MADTFVSRPAAPAEHGSTYGGFAEIARRLNALHPERHIPISRQLVAKWYEHRGTNQFPERYPVEVDGKVYHLFDLQAVDRWHVWWLRKRNVNPPIETIPLFDVDHSGHPADAEQSAYRSHGGVREDYRSSVLDL